MKCGYSNCKLGGEVEKSEAEKISTRYYHKECYNKKIAKDYIRDLMVKNGMIAKTVNMALKKIIDEKDYDPKYVTFVAEKVFANNEKINNAFGLNYYLENYRYIEMYEVIRRRKLASKVKSMGESETSEETTFKYNKKQNKNWLKVV